MLMQKVLNDETPLYKLGFLSSLNEERLERIWSSRDQWQVNKENIHLYIRLKAGGEGHDRR